MPMPLDGISRNAATKKKKERKEELDTDDLKKYPCYSIKWEKNLTVNDFVLINCVCMYA